MKKLITLLMLLLTVCSGAWAANYYSPSSDEVIILNNVYSATDAGYSTHSAVAWAGTASSSSKKAGDPNNNGAATSSTVPCYSVKGNGKGKNITLSITGVSKIIVYHESHASRYVELRSESKSGTLIGKGSAGTYYTEVNLSETTSYDIFLHGTGSGSDDQDFNVYAIKLIKGGASPSITVQPKGASYLSGETITPLSVEATASSGNLSYQWYTCDDVNKNNAEAIDGATKNTYTPSATGYYYCCVSDENGSANSNAVLVSISSATAPTISVAANPGNNITAGTAVTLTATTTGYPVPTIQWYSNTTASNTDGTLIEGETKQTYSPSTTNVGTFYYYAVATNGISPDATSEVITLTVTSPDKTIEGNNYYVAVGENVVNIERIICNDISMQYLTGEASNTATENNMINSLNSNYVASISSGTNGWGVEFTPSVNGKLAVGLIANNGKTFSITNVQSFGFRSHDADYVSTGLDHGTIFGSSWTPATKFYGIITIAVVAGTTYEFSVAGSKMSFYGFEFTPMPATVSGEITASGFNTYSSNYPLDLSTITGGMAYVATSISEGKVVLTKCTDKVPATTGLFIAGTQGETFTISTTDDETVAPADNLFVGMPNGGQVAKAADNEFNYVFGWSDVSNPGFYLVNATLPTLDAFKAFLHTTEALDAPTSSRLSFVFGDETTAISDVTRESEGMKNGETYNLNGQRISRPSKGLYIVNGKKLIMK